MTQDGSQDKARIAALEAELEEMTAALAQAWDQLVPFLQETPKEANGAQDVTPVLETVMAALDADMGALYMCPHESRQKEWLTLPGNVLGPEAFEVHLAEVDGRTSPLLVQSIRSACGLNTQWLLMPIRVSDQMVGAIGVGIRAGQRDFSALDARTLIRMTDRVASQIVVADLAESKAREAQAAHEMQIAGNIQLSLQPVGQLNLPGVQVVADWHPASSVGGDAWGQVQQDEDTLALFVVDVAGKGLPASLAAVSLHTALTTMLRLGYNPVETVTMLNNQMYDSYTDAGIMATVAVARINVKTGEFEQANAGHTPTLVALDGKWHEWTATMPPLGVLPDFSPQCQHARLTPGDLVIFYSDGLSEIETTDGLWGSQGLIDAVKTLNEPDAKHAANAILQAAAILRGENPPHDDQTLLNIYYTGSTNE